MMLLSPTHTTTAMMIKRIVLSALCLFTLSATAAEVNTSAKEQLSDTYVRSALSYLTFAEALETDEPGALASALLDEATQLNPKNTQAWSMWAELAQSNGDQEAYEKAMVGYLNTGIDDDRARFNLIQFRLSNNNTLDAQLTEVETILNSPAGNGFSGPLRSRLASFASSVALELGDERARRKWAVEAARADPANLEAAQAMLKLVIELGGNAVKRGTATVNVVKAAPLDPGARLDLAMQLAEQGAYVRAAQQYQVVSTRLSSQPLPLESYINWANCLAMTGQDKLLLQLMDEFEAALNQNVAKPAEEDEENVADPAAAEDAPDQVKLDLPLGLELIRLAVLRDGEDQDQAQLVFDRIARQLSAQPDKAQDEAGDAEADKAAAEEARQNLKMIAAVFCPDLDQAVAIIEENGGDPVAMGWITLRRGDKAKALQQFQPHTQADAMAACGLAIATAHDNAGRARLLQNFIESDAATPLAKLAAGREMLKIETPAQPTTTGKALLALMAKSPESFWLVDVERTPWLDVRMKIKPQRIKPLEPITAEITVWNTSRFPLAIDPRGPISQNAVVTLSATSGGRALPQTSPIVVDLGRSFTLKAGERLIIDTRLDFHQFGVLRANNPGVPLYFDTRVLVNPALNHAGLWRPTTIGGLSDVRDCLVEARPTSAEAIDQWLTDIDSKVVSTRLLALQRLAALNRESQPDLIDPAMVERVNAAMMQAWDKATIHERAWIINSAVGLDQEKTTYPGLREKAINSDAKQVWMALLINHAIKADSTILTTAIGKQGMQDVSRFAEKQLRMVKDIEKFKAEQEAAQPAGTQPGE
jgi:hypothetical protein